MNCWRAFDRCSVYRADTGWKPVRDTRKVLRAVARDGIEGKERRLRALARAVTAVSVLAIGLTVAFMPAVPALAIKPLPGTGGPEQAQDHLGRLRPADVLIVAGKPLPAGLAARLRRLPGVAAAVLVDGGRIKMNGVFVNVLGVGPAFRPFAAAPTARSAKLWQNVAAGG